MGNVLKEIPSTVVKTPGQMQSRHDRRFTLAEKSELELPVAVERSMGFANRPRNRDHTENALSGRSKSTPGSLVTTQASLAALSGVPPEQEPKFDPVPDGAGYSITADTATNFDLKTKTVVFSGNVSLHCKEFTLSADRLVVHMESAGGQLSRLVANGNVDVHLTQGSTLEQYHGTGEEAMYDPARQTILFLGWPRIRGHGREHRAASAATRMTLHVNPARLVTEGRAQTRILPGEGGSLSGFGTQAAVR